MIYWLFLQHIPWYMANLVEHHSVNCNKNAKPRRNITWKCSFRFKTRGKSHRMGLWYVQKICILNTKIFKILKSVLLFKCFSQNVQRNICFKCFIQISILQFSALHGNLKLLFILLACSFIDGQSSYSRQFPASC